MSKIEVNTVEPQCGTTLTLGGSGDTVALGSGASQAGVGAAGSVDWVTDSIKTATFTAVSGSGYFCNTTGGAFNITLPTSPSAGDIVALKDYAGTFATYNLTIDRNGSNLDGNAGNKVLSSANLSMTLVYVDGTQGWKSIEEGTGYIGESFMVATGGTITTSGNDKIHKFTGPGTFTVCSVADTAANNLVSYMVVAGGGSGMGKANSPFYFATGGGGAGGYREVVSPSAPYTGAPTQGYPTPGNRITVTATDYPITVGAGGATVSAIPGAGQGNPGSASVFSTISSAGGGGGGSGTNSPIPQSAGLAGGSGGGGGAGAACKSCGGAGNTPPVTPAQGSNGGTGSSGSNTAGAGGGGATAVGGNASVQPSPMIADGGDGGAGATTNITGSPVAYAGGGGGASGYPGACGSAAGAGGTGGGGTGPASGSGTDGTVNTGGGAGGAGGPSPSATGGAGGSGIVIIRYKYQ